MEKLEATLALKLLPMYSVVVEDGTWVDRFAERLLNPVGAAEAAREAILDAEVMNRGAILSVLFESEGVPPESLAAVLREVWLDSGVFSEPEDLTAMFLTARRAEQCLMNSEELTAFRDLPESVVVYRGQIYGDGKEIPAGASWTLSEEVANWYAAPVEQLGQPMGWVLRALVPKKAVLALFLERGEHEVVLDLTMFKTTSTSIEAWRGTCDEFPEHLASARIIPPALP